MRAAVHACLGIEDRPEIIDGAVSTDTSGTPLTHKTALSLLHESDMTRLLGDDELLAIFDHLSPAELLGAAALVCRRWTAVGQSDAAWQPRVNSSSFRVLATAIRAGTGSFPLRRLYGVHDMVFAPQNLLANPNFDARMQKRDGYAAMSTQRPWTTTKIGGQGWNWTGDPHGILDTEALTLPLPFRKQPFADGTKIRAVESSYQWSELMQPVELLQHCIGGGLCAREATALLDVSPALEFSVFVGSRTDQVARSEILVLLDDGTRILPPYMGSADYPWHQGEGVLAHARVPKDAVPQQGTWQRHSVVLQGYPPGVRRAIVVLRGTDTQFWAGHYGAKFAAPELHFLLPHEIAPAIRQQSNTFISSCNHQQDKQ